MASLSSGRYTCRRSSISLSVSDVVVAISVVVIVTDSVVFDVDVFDDFG